MIFYWVNFNVSINFLCLYLACKKAGPTTTPNENVWICLRAYQLRKTLTKIKSKFTLQQLIFKILLRANKWGSFCGGFLLLLLLLFFFLNNQTSCLTQENLVGCFDVRWLCGHTHSNLTGEVIWDVSCAFLFLATTIVSIIIKFIISQSLPTYMDKAKPRQVKENHQAVCLLLFLSLIPNYMNYITCDNLEHFVHI